MYYINDYKCTLINKRDVFCSISCDINNLWDWLVKNERPQYIDFLHSLGVYCYSMTCCITSLVLDFNSDRFPQLKYFSLLQVSKNWQFNQRHSAEV